MHAHHTLFDIWDKNEISVFFIYERKYNIISKQSTLRHDTYNNHGVSN